VVIRPDQRIVVAAQNSSYFGLLRYEPDGDLDPTFDGDGMAVYFQGSVFDVATAPGGKVVMGGYRSVSQSDRDFVVARVKNGGALDPTFSGDGVVTTSFGGPYDQVSGIAVLGDGRILAAGNGGDSPQVFALARYTTSGDLDPTFSGNGKETTDVSGSAAAYAVVIQADGKVVAAGIGGDDMAVVRYNTNGTLNTAFGGDGRVTIGFSRGDSIDMAYAVAIQPADGRIVAAGKATLVGGRRVAVARVLAS
jgi:uncharacterized delta-60 repeat protein